MRPHRFDTMLPGKVYIFLSVLLLLKTASAATPSTAALHVGAFLEPKENQEIDTPSSPPTVVVIGNNPQSTSSDLFPIHPSCDADHKKEVLQCAFKELAHVAQTALEELKKYEHSSKLAIKYFGMGANLEVPKSFYNAIAKVSTSPFFDTGSTELNS
jgi:hypothetical protein